MTKLWFKTKNDQIVDLNSFCEFHYRDPSWSADPDDVTWHVYANDRIFLARFNTKEEAQAYLDEIYLLLTDTNSVDADSKSAIGCKIAHSLPDCLNQCDPTTYVKINKKTLLGKSDADSKSVDHDSINSWLCANCHPNRHHALALQGSGVCDRCKYKGILYFGMKND